MAYAFLRSVLVTAACALPAISVAQSGACGNPFQTGTGPWDYRTASSSQRALVENRHFTPDVRAMRPRAGTTKHLASDIGYTLRVFPNHHQALMTMSDWALKTRQNPPQGSEFTVECWFERALIFAPDDAMVKTVYGTALIKRGKTKEAIAQLEAALQQAGNNANVHYNLGLAYFDVKDYAKALESAHSAYRLGFPLPGLKNKLQRVGAWREPSAAAGGH